MVVGFPPAVRSVRYVTRAHAGENKVVRDTKGIPSWGPLPRLLPTRHLTPPSLQLVNPRPVAWAASHEPPP
jgi:hypothetical protein